MNNPPTLDDMIIIVGGISLGILCILFLIWFNLFRKKKQALGEDTESNEDTAFNALYQARSIVKVLSDKGVDTSRSEKILEEAESELDRKHYTSVIALANTAKSLARQEQAEPSDEIVATKEYVAKPIGVSSRPSARKVITYTETEEEEIPDEEPSEKMMIDEPVEFAYYKPKTVQVKPDMTERILNAASTTTDEEVLPEESESFAFRKKMPENYMESKFKIELARDTINSARNDGKDTGQAEEYLSEAKALFDEKNYSLALSTAVKAEKSATGKLIEPEPVETVIPVKQQEAVSAHIPVIVTESARKAAGAVPKSPNCVKCGAKVTTDDNFCRKCGTKVEKTLNCPSCTIELEVDDMFCRKCGTKVDHITRSE